MFKKFMINMVRHDLDHTLQFDGQVTPDLDRNEPGLSLTVNDIKMLFL
jgi:hypothetical protein